MLEFSLYTFDYNHVIKDFFCRLMKNLVKLRLGGSLAVMFMVVNASLQCMASLGSVSWLHHVP